MIIGIDNLIEFLKVNNCTKWQLRTAPDKDAFILKAHPDENFDTAIQRLQDTLQLYAGEKLYLEAWEKDGQTKNWFRTWIKINTQTQTSQSINSFPVISGLTPDEVDRRINEAVKKTQMEYRLTELERENNELKKEYKDFEKEKNSLQNQLIQRVTPYVGTLLQNFFPKVAVAGPIPGQESVPVDYDGPENVSFEESGAIDEVRLASVLQRLFAVEPDLIEILEAVALKAESNPTQWQQYKPMILSFLK